MEADLTERKRQAVRAKSEALRGELRRWRENSAMKAPLEKHHSQIRRITSRLDGLLDRVEAELRAPDLDVITQGRVIEEKLLTAHVIWEFFRAKFAQRLDAGFKEYLRVCDELAWVCYSPVRDKFLAQPGSARDAMTVKEPPLVFLNGGWSPFALGRESAFQVERVSGGWLSQQDFRRLVESLPVPLIGLPWFQVAHLPDAVVIAHEVGHIVEWDFGLTDVLKEALDTAVPKDRAGAWSTWLTEVFADLYGCLATGLAFAATLMDFLAQDKARLAADRRNPDAWGIYPPAWLRAKLLLSTLSELGWNVDELTRRHAALFGEPQANLDFADDAVPVTRALLDCPCLTLSIKDDAGPRAPRVRELLPHMPTDPVEVGRNIMSGWAAGSTDTRVLMASARWAWESDPSAYMAKRRDQTIRTLVRTLPGVRGTSSASVPVSEQVERELGKDWFDALDGNAVGVS